MLMEDRGQGNGGSQRPGLDSLSEAMDVRVGAIRNAFCTNTLPAIVFGNALNFANPLA